MRVIFLNRFFYPDHSATAQMLSDLAFGLAAEGIAVSVISSRLRYGDGDDLLPAREMVHGVEAIRIWTSKFGRCRLLFRASDYLTFYVSAIFNLLRILRRGDILIAMTDPPMLSVITLPLARLRGARSINWLQDLFPEVADALGIFGRYGKAMFIFLRRLRDDSLRRSDMNVVIGDLMAERLAGRGVTASRIRVIPNWADCNAVRPVDIAENTLRDAWRLNDAFVIGYSGNLGRAHDLETLLRAAALLESQPRSADSPAIRWLFVGGGHLFSEAGREVTARGLRSIVFQPYQPRDKLSLSLSAADAHLVILRPELEGLIVPSKFYGVAAAGRATIFIGSATGELARVIKRHSCGVQVQAGDADGLAAAILALARDTHETKRMGERARIICEDRYDKARAIRRWLSLLGHEKIDPEKNTELSKDECQVREAAPHSGAMTAREADNLISSEL